MRKTQKYLSLILVISILLCSFLVTAYAADGDACVSTTDCTGTYENGFCTVCDGYEPALLMGNYYVIENAGNLYWFAEQVNSGNTSINAFLTDNIVVNTGDVAGCDGTMEEGWREWIDMGSYAMPYSGFFDGMDYTISGLYYKASSYSSQDYDGLFGCSSGTVANLGVVNSYFYAWNYFGGIVGYNSGTIDSCYFSGTMKGYENVGGIAGYNAGGTVSDCYFDGTVSASYMLGGIAGFTNGIVKNCCTFGSVTAPDSNCYYVGAIAGFNNGYGTNGVFDCYYLENSAFDGTVVQNGLGKKENGATTEDADGSTIKKAEADFADGSITYSLNGGVTDGSQAWYQTVGEGRPALSGRTVHFSYASCSQSGEGAYSNTATPAHQFSNGFCSGCGGYERPAGQGTVEAPYLIDNAGKLYWFAAVVNSGYGGVQQNLSACAKLTANITDNTQTLSASVAGDRTWTPIGTVGDGFSGDFNGNGKTISGLYYKNASKDNIGIFSKIAEGGCVSSISVENSFFQGNYYVGSIAGINYGTIKGCTNHSKASASYYVGGIAGENNGLITGCSNTADLSNAGGIATRNYGTISDCTNSGNITGGGSGGITRWNPGTIINCSNSGTISGSSGSVGGISYTCVDGKISHCVNIGAVKGTGTSSTNERVGGIIGWNEGTIEYCVNKGTLSGARTLYDAQFGGIAGRNDDLIRCCANLANLSLTGVSKVGGIVGYAGHMTTSTVQDCYNIGNIRGYGSAVAGICGDSASAPSVLIKNCYNYGTVGTGAMYSSTYGIVGSSSTSKTVVLNCYVLSDSADVSGTDVTDATAEEFASGKIAWLLNGEAATGESVWGQNIDGADPDPYPVFGTPLVYYGKTDCQEEDRYTNTQTGVGIHTMKKTSAVEATCTADGNNEYYTCSKCGGVFADSNGDTETTAAEQTIGRIPHAFGAPTFTWAEDHSSCSAAYTCEYGCGETESETCTVVTETVAGADCKHQGTITHTATCGEYTDTVELPGAYGEHTSGEPVRENVVEATCKKAGSYEEVVYCTVCSAELSRTKKTIEKLTEHLDCVTIEMNRVESTCVTAGGYDEVTVCTICEERVSSRKVQLPLADHTMEKADFNWAEDYSCQVVISCTVEGCTESKTEACTVTSKTTESKDCQTPGTIAYSAVFEEFTDTITIETGYAEHRQGSAVRENEVPATCLEEGSYDEVVYCSVCEIELSREKKTIEKSETHTEETIPGKAATCAEPGLKEGKKCGVCGIILVAQEEIPALGHSFADGVCGNCGLYGGYCGDADINGGKNVMWLLDSEGLMTISGTGKMEDYSAYNVPWIDHRAKVKALVVEEGVTRLGTHAFRSCTAMETVSLPESLTVIGDNAFAFCSVLTSVSLPRNLSSIEGHAFYYCDALTEITIPASVKSMGTWIFNSNGLKTVTFEGSAPYINTSAFYGVTATVYYPDEDSSWEGVAGHDFGGLLTWVPPVEVALVVGKCGDDLTWRFNTLENTLWILGTGAMYDFTEDTVPWAEYRERITSVDLSDEMTHLGDFACYGLSKLKSITIPKGMTSLGTRVFEGCAKLQFSVDSSNRSFSENNGALYDYTDSILYSAPSVSGVFTAHGYTNTVTDYAFAGNDRITRFEAAARITSINPYAFSGCTNLSELYFPGIAPTIGENAFLGVTATAEYLSNQSSWTSDVLQNYGGRITWKKLDVIAAVSRSDLSWVLTADGVMRFYGQYAYEIPGGCNPNGGAWYQYRDYIKHVIIPSQFRRVNAYAFYGCTNLESVTMDRVYDIGERAFYGCASLKSIYLHGGGNDVTVGDYAFYNCTSLKEASFDIRTSLGAYSFANCFSLEEIYFNSSGSSLSPFSAQNSSFSGVTADVLCPYKVSLISSQFGGTLTYKNVDYGTCGTNIRWSFDASTGTLTLTGTGTTSSYFSGSFTPWTYRNDQIKAIHVGEGITNLPSYIFEYCTAVTQVKLPETLASFSPNAFNDCKVLNNLLIPRGVSEIAKDNFNRCNNLTDIYYLGTAAEWDQIKNSDSFKVRLDDGDAAFTVHFLQWHEPTATCEESGVEGHYAFEEPSVYDHMYDQDWQKITTLERVPALGHEWTGGSCTTPKICVNCGKDDGTVPGHKWNNADCTTPKTCSVCGETEGEPLGHKWNDATCTEPKACSVCGETEGEALGHKWSDATCTEPKTCSVCGETEGEALGHKWSDATCTTPKTCSVCGETEGEALGHKWNDATCTEPKTCSVCGETEGEALGHKWNDATCTEPKTCSVCGETEGEALGHKWNDATCTEPKTCSVCGETEGEALGHKWTDATCTTPKTCSVCGETEGEALGHKWTDATCTEPKTCSVCGETEGEALGHKWNDATCTEPKTCSVCGETEGEALGHKWTDADCTTPKTCSVCGETEGEPLGHKWTDADCTTPKTCSVCGETEGEALGHDFVDGKCSRCEEKDPDYKEPEVTGVTRIFGATRYDTAFKAADQLKANLGIEKFQNIVVAYGEDFADALSGSYLANQKNAPILLVKNRNKEINLVKDYIKANLTPGGTVYLLGGENAVPKAMESGLEGFNVKRLAGATRYETNLEILKEAGISGNDILVCTGKDFADGLSASAVNKPILLVKDSLRATQVNYLKTLGTKNFYLIGGTNAVNKRIESALSTYGTTQRIEGATRYYTSVNIAKTFFPNAQTAVLAYAQNFPDGLSGGCLACSMNAPLILTANGKQAPAVAYAKEAGITGGAVLGGTGLIPDRVANSIFQIS